MDVAVVVCPGRVGMMFGTGAGAFIMIIIIVVSISIVIIISIVPVPIIIIVGVTISVHVVVVISHGTCDDQMYLVHNYRRNHYNGYEYDPCYNGHLSKC